MNSLARSVACAALAISAAGCTHTVPGLIPGKTNHYNAAPTVEALVDHITCELRDANAQTGGKLAAEKYLIGVTLLLQVDDQFGTTPNVTYTEGLKAPAKDLVTQLGLGLDGQRRRTFTTTYNIQAEDLAKVTVPICAGYTDGREKLYSLNGNLRLKEIVASGLAARERGGGIITNRTDASDKSAPTFGSQVQFIVTQSMSSLGPTWTLRYFKGPSGSAGLFNGKILYTNSATVAFAPTREVPRPSPKTAALESSLTRAQARLKAAQAENARLKAQLESPAFKLRSADLKVREQLAATFAEGKVRTNETEVEQLQAELDGSRRDDTDRAQSLSREAGVAMTRDLLTTMLLQNLPSR